MFNILQSRFEMEAFEAFDLFAGSGALGFEAFSRGVESVHFFEIDRQCHKVLKSNIQNLLLTDHCSISLKDATQWAKSNKWSGGPKLFLLDPPYNSDLAQKIICTLGQAKSIPEFSVIALETEKDKKLIYPEHFHLGKQQIIGKTRIDFIEIILQTEI